MTFGWLHSIRLTPTHSIISYGNIFDLRPLSQEHNYGVKQRYATSFLCEFVVSSLIPQSGS